MKTVWSKAAVELWLRTRFPDPKQREIVRRMLFRNAGKVYAIKPLYYPINLVSILHANAIKNGKTEVLKITSKILEERRKARELKRIEKILREVAMLDKTLSAVTVKREKERIYEYGNVIQT